MNTVKADGVLRHGFFGKYVATIVLVFADAESARDGLKTLGEGWEPGKMKEGKAIVWLGDSAALDAVKATFARFGLKTACGYEHCKHRCKDAGIDSVNHSVDFGPPFEVEIPVTPGEQTSLFGGAS